MSMQVADWGRFGNVRYRMFQTHNRLLNLFSLSPNAAMPVPHGSGIAFDVPSLSHEREGLSLSMLRAVNAFRSTYPQKERGHGCFLRYWRIFPHGGGYQYRS